MFASTLADCFSLCKISFFPLDSVVVNEHSASHSFSGQKCLSCNQWILQVKASVETGRAEDRENLCILCADCPNVDFSFSLFL